MINSKFLMKQNYLARMRIILMKIFNKEIANSLKFFLFKSLIYKLLKEIYIKKEKFQKSTKKILFKNKQMIIFCKIVHLMLKIYLAKNNNYLVKILCFSLWQTLMNN